jgi:alginate O-acetyltransferase complex protein AlgI
VAASVIFTELRFLGFFFAVFVVYWALASHRARKAWLLVVSYAFYAAWDWRFLSLILVSTVVDYVVGRALPDARGARRRGLLTTSLVVNLGILGLFKYANFFLDSGVGLFRFLGLPVSDVTLQIVLPVGISFYTFQTLSYTIDVYRGRLEPTRSPLDFATFVAFFPQLVAGPIVRAADFLPQLTAPRRLADVAWRAHLLLFLSGFFKKACVADNLAPAVDAYFAAPSTYDTASCWVAIAAYAIQIYGDFSGYSDMAIATAGLLGFRLCDNFAHPYFALDITDFWRRWHMSLSSWLRDYLYIPLGGNRGSTLFTYRNLMLTMVLGGLWHGASWNFVIWGVLHGLALIVHRLVGRSASPSPVRSATGWVVTLWWVGLCWIFFRAESLATAIDITGVYTGIGALLGVGSAGAEALPARYALAVLVCLALHAVSYRVSIRPLAARLPVPVFIAAYAVFFQGAWASMAIGDAPFIYFQF